MPNNDKVSGSGTATAKAAAGAKVQSKAMMILRIIFTLQNWIKTETASAIP